MSTEAAPVSVQWIESQSVVSMHRIIEDQAELLEAITGLRERVDRRLTGPPTVLFLGRTDTGGFEVELAFPVPEGTTVEEMMPRLLPADYVFSAIHRGPYVKTESADGLREAAQRVGEWIQTHGLLAGDNPTRYVYVEGPEAHGTDTDRYVTEIQISYHWPVWLDSLRRGISDHAGAEVAAAATQDGEALLDTFEADRIRSWVLRAIDCLDQAIPDDEDRACILQDCAHRYPRVHLDRMRRVYEEIGDLRRFIQRLSKDKKLFPGRLWLDETGETPLIYIERSVPPWNREAYDKATDPVEKRYHACFCSMVREAILTREPVSPSFCNCSSGWFVQMWEAILDRRLRIDLVESVLQGDDRCLFAVHLPEKSL